MNPSPTTVASNDPACRANTKPGHVCHDKYGAPWFRPDAGPRPFTTCWYETLCQLEDDRLAERAELAAFADALAAAGTFEDVVGL